MPIYPPRNNSIKKQQDLDWLGYQLSVSKEETRDKLEKLVEKFRKANLNFTKSGNSIGNYPVFECRIR